MCLRHKPPATARRLRRRLSGLALRLPAEIFLRNESLLTSPACFGIAAVQKYGGDRMYFAPPIDYDKVMRQVPRGMVLTVGKIREYFARESGADFTEPITAGIFVSIVAYYLSARRTFRSRSINALFSPYFYRAPPTVPLNSQARAHHSRDFCFHRGLGQLSACRGRNTLQKKCVKQKIRSVYTGPFAGRLRISVYGFTRIDEQ